MPEPDTTPVEGAQKVETNEFQHIKLIEANKIDGKKLPKAIRQKISIFETQVKRYNKKPSEDFYNSLKRQDIVIANDIQNWVEKDMSDETPEQKTAREAKQAQDKIEEDAKAKEKADADKIKADADAKAKEDADAEANDPNLKLEKAVREKIVDGKISTADLQAALGRKPDTYNGKEKLGKLILQKIWLHDVWEVK